MRNKPELHIVIDQEGVRSIQLIGPVETHSIAHEIYLKIRHLIAELDVEITEELKRENIN